MVNNVIADNWLAYGRLKELAAKGDEEAAAKVKAMGNAKPGDYLVATEEDLADLELDFSGVEQLLRRRGRTP